MNYYNIKPWQTYIDFMGVIYIVTEVSEKWVVLVDEDAIIYKFDRLEFISEVMGARYHKVISTELNLHANLS